MRIGLDLDGVMYPFTERFTQYVKTHSHWGERLDFQPATCWEFYKVWGLTTAQFLELMEEAVHVADLFREGPITPGARDVVRLLEAAGHEPVICTTRGDYAREATRKWLYAHRLGHLELIITDRKAEHGLDVLLDDAPHNIIEARAAGCRAITYTQPWNQGLEGERVGSWGQFGVRMGLNVFTIARLLREAGA